MFRRNVILALSVILLSGCITATPPRPILRDRGNYAPVRKYMSDFIRWEMRKFGIVGLSIAMVDGRQTVWTEGFGHADLSKERPATADTAFRVGSISKLITATAVMQLVEQGRLDLDAPLQAVLPEFEVRSRTPGAPPVTVRHLLTHHSGLPSDLLKGELLDRPPSKEAGETFSSLPAVLGGTWLAHPPGQVWAYSNLGYGLLGAVVERASGRDFMEYVDENILAPLEMEHSSFVEKNSLLPLLAEGYTRGRQEQRYYLRDMPAGSFISSANDLARFMKMILARGQAPSGRPVLQASTMRQMVTPQNADVALDADFRIGLGYWLVNPLQIPGVRLVSHGGDIPPFHSLLVTAPDQGLGVAVLTNSEEGAAAVFHIATEALLMALEMKTGIRIEDKANPIVDLDPRELDGHAGIYTSPMGLIEVERYRDGLRASVFGRRFLLFPRKDGSFSLQLRLLSVQSKLFGHMLMRIQALERTTVTTHRIEGRRYVAVRPGGVFMGVAERITPTPVPSRWQERAGRYEILNPDGRSALGEIGLEYDRRLGLMILALRVFDQRMAFPLNILSDREAVVHGQGRNMGETVSFDEEGGREVLSYSGYRARRVF